MSLQEIEADFSRDLSTIKTKADLFNVKSRYLGKEGRLQNHFKTLKGSNIEAKRTLGTATNRTKRALLEALEKRLSELEIEQIDKNLSRKWQDITLRDSVRDLGLNSGGLHPVSLITREIEDIFESMGFEVLDGPHIEDDYHNFEALNTPTTHPARDMQDTFWFPDLCHLLRTHTSSIQVRGMETHTPPFRFIGPGLVFRCEATDASHEIVFHQLEGMLVDKGVTVGNLIFFMKTLLGEIFQEDDISVRLRPGYFPFVEPGFELDIECRLCRGQGCSLCKQEGWIELLPCGMVHPNVLRSGGIDPTLYNGFAFGLGLSRLVMMRYHIADIRLLLSGDLAFLSQFKSH